MEIGRKEQLVEDVTKELIDKVPCISKEAVADVYLVSYLPLIAGSLAAISDSLEKLVKDVF